MNIWFIRCNGETAHNQPGTRLYMPGEPPVYPEKRFNYVETCLQQGFARVGHPATGDLRDADWRARAIETYGNLISPEKIDDHERFASIEAGDIVLLPTYQERFYVHLGIAIYPRHGNLSSGGRAYYYHYDIPAGDWFENAHRVDVHWAKTSDGTFRVFYIPEIGGSWRRGFRQVKSGNQRIMQLARDSALIR